MPKFSEQIVDDSGYQRPVEGALVFLLDRDGNEADTDSPNPTWTDNFGVFSFVANDGAYRFSARMGGVEIARGDALIGSPPAFVGAPGPADNTYTTYAALLASDPTRKSARLVPQAGEPEPAGNFSYIDGAWVRQDARSLSARLDAPGAAILSQDDVNAERISVLRFGADPTGQRETSDDIQKGLDWLSSVGGGTLELTRGNYRITKPINIPGNVSLEGQGPCSFLRPNGCNGINILQSDEIGPRRIANLWVYGNGAENFAGINIALDVPTRATGMVIENCYISFFGTGILSKGLWHSTIRTNTIHQVHRGIVLYGRNVKVMMQDNRVTKGTLVSGSGPSVGIQVGDETAGLRPEDIQVHDNIFVDFSRGCYWRQALFGAVTHNDFDYCTEAGILFVTADGGTAFSDNWIQVDNKTADVYGIRGTALGTLPGIDNIEIHNNRMRATDVKVVPGEMHSFGLDFGDKQANISCSGNSVQGAFEVDLRADGVQRSSFRDNHGSSQAIIFNCFDVAVAGNTFPTGMTISGNVSMDYGKNFGLHTTEVFGSVTVPAGATTVTATYLSLNMPDLPQGGSNIACVATDRGNLTHGGIAVAPTRTAITVTCQTAIANLPSAIDFHLRIY